MDQSDKKAIKKSVSTPFTSILTIIFVIAKLTGVLDWSWWWVFSPLWFPLAIVLTFLLIVSIISFIIYITED